MAMSKTSPPKRTSTKAGTEDAKAGVAGANGHVPGLMNQTMMLHQKLLELRKRIHNLQPDQEGDTFSFVSIKKVITAVRPVMDELGILLNEEVIESDIKQVGSGHFMVKVAMVFTWINSEHPKERESARFEGLGIDDKGTERSMGIAQSYCEKMFLLKNLQIPQNDLDPDAKQPGVHASKDPKKNDTAPEAPPAPDVAPPSDVSFVDGFCHGLKEKKDWDAAYNLLINSQQFAACDSKLMDEALEHFNRLFESWSSCQ